MKFMLCTILLIILSMNLISALCNENQIDINTASAEELDKITNIGPKTAIKIIEARPFSSIEDLIKVNGIGNLTLEEIQVEALACVDEEKAQAEDNFTSNTKELEEQEAIFLSNNNESKPVNLNPKTIKTEENSSFQDKGAYLYLLLGFCIVLAILYLIQNKGNRKNEFRQS